MDTASRTGATPPRPYTARLSTPVHTPRRALPRVLLASRSPRRRELLAAALIEHELIDSGVDDADLLPGDTSPEGWVTALAYLKASAALERLCPVGGGGRLTDLNPAVIVGADTVVVESGEIIGQPRDREHAAAIIERLSGKLHSVLTGVAIIDTEASADGNARRELFVDRAEVHVEPLTAIQIQTYLDTGLWQGKAGAYNLAERLNDGWPITYTGDPHTIMGLPTALLISKLERWHG